MYFFGGITPLYLIHDGFILTTFHVTLQGHTGIDYIWNNHPQSISCHIHVNISVSDVSVPELTAVNRTQHYQL